MAYLSLVIVGLGSWAFHMTLLYPMQLLDEVRAHLPTRLLICSQLPMIYGSCVLIFNLQSSKITTGSAGVFLIAALISFSFVITYSYLDHKDALFHEVAYGFQVCELGSG